VTITSEESEDYGQDFDLEDPENEHRMFRITIQTPYIGTGLLVAFAVPPTLSGSIVFVHPGGTVVQ
jgi:hypothetical protein